jgi:4-hydroxybenzoate polyprenyltransferase
MAILWSFGIFCGYLVQFSKLMYVLWLFGTFPSFWYAERRKIWQAWRHAKGGKQIGVHTYAHGLEKM